MPNHCSLHATPGVCLAPIAPHYVSRWFLALRRFFLPKPQKHRKQPPKPPLAWRPKPLVSWWHTTLQSAMCEGITLTPNMELPQDPLLALQCNYFHILAQAWCTVGVKPLIFRCFLFSLSFTCILPLLLTSNILILITPLLHPIAHFKPCVLHSLCIFLLFSW